MMMQLSSGLPLPRRDDGRPAYRPGQLALGAALVGLKPHRFDRDKHNHEVAVLLALDLVPDDVLAVVAEEIEERKLKCQPRLAEIERMCRAALGMQRIVAAALAQRQRPARARLRRRASSM
jgi:hypothetical protein